MLNGQRLISNAQTADFILVAAKTDPSAGARGVSLLILETADAKGFALGRNLKKIGCKVQDTSELFFENVRIPAENLLGGVEGRGFYQLMQRLPEERLIMAMSAVVNMEAACDEAIAYCKDRRTFGKRIIDHQSARFTLAEAKTTTTVARAYSTLYRPLRRRPSTRAGAMSSGGRPKSAEVIDNCLQLFGGYAIVRETPMASWTDARLGRIAGGTNEIMKDLIGRAL